MNSNKLVEIDILKSVGIFFVIYVHLPVFFSDIQTVPYAQSAIPLGLSCFFFTSSYTLSKYNNFSDDNKIETFLIKRAKRIYPLYWTAIISYIIIFGFLKIKADTNNLSTIGITDYIAIMMGAHELSLDFPPVPYLWYIGAILFFYVLYVLIIKYANSEFDILRNSLLIFLSMHLISFPSSIYMYYPVFIAGIFAGRARALSKFNPYTSKIPTEVTNVFSYIAYSSYAVYLFHGPILSIMETINSYFGLSGYIGLLYLLCVDVPIMFLGCYCIQQVADGKLDIKNLNSWKFGYVEYLSKSLSISEIWKK
ncbi:acyltransferase family protein [Methanolobus sediminis]|uniref:Acyltransferase family protein n=1 Tax=Methanolobus sediminis TaxID=3072978 RepID=A0AA51UJP5_9EURY|nr:acyltransferase family protein [Methanolobus sediminis]WMW24512.1 acyltransferase family protein [Methanolobus sediminis]